MYVKFLRCCARQSRVGVFMEQVVVMACLVRGPTTKACYKRRFEKFPWTPPPFGIPKIAALKNYRGKHTYD